MDNDFVIDDDALMVDDIDGLLEAPDDGSPGSIDEMTAKIDGDPNNKRRKKKISKISAAYDPTPEYQSLGSGELRPEVRCWVDSDIARPVNIEDLHPLWRRDTQDMGTKERKDRFLASKVVLVAGDYFVKSKTDGRWVCRKRLEVKSILMNDWGREITDFHIGPETVSEFLSANELVVLEATAYIPGGGDFSRVQGRLCLNVWSELPMPFAIGASETEEFELLLNLIVRNLVGVDRGSPEEWVEEIASAAQTPLRWFFHWIASNYQRPGRSLPTALWIVGRNQGVGKGLFTKGMASLVGARNVKMISVEEFRSEWTDWIADAALHVGDEIDLTQRKELYDRTKRLIGNPIISIRKRNEGVREVPAVANFIFTTNDVSPLNLDQHDRRHTFFETGGDEDAKDLAEEFYNLGEHRRRLAFEGLAEFLNMIEIDEKFISTAIMTDVKRDIIDINRDPVEDWLSSAKMQTAWPAGFFAKSEWLANEYEDWAREKPLPQAMKSGRYCLRKIRESSRTDQLSKQERVDMPDGSRPRGYVRLDPATFKDYKSAAELPVAPVGPQPTERVKNIQKALKKTKGHLKLVETG